MGTALSLLGCRNSAMPPAPTDEPTLAEQAEAVREGRSDTVRLDHALVCDDDLAVLDGLEAKLRRVNLSHTEISDGGLARLCKNTQLEQLRLASSRVSDAGTESIAGLKQLRFLHLLDAPVTDAGLDRLHGLEKLESLYLDHTNVTDEGLARLIKALPQVHLHIDDHHHPLDPHAKEHEH
jgi:hypothetical protein